MSRKALIIKAASIGITRKMLQIIHNFPGDSSMKERRHPFHCGSISWYMTSFYHSEAQQNYLWSRWCNDTNFSPRLTVYCWAHQSTLKSNIKMGKNMWNVSLEKTIYSMITRKIKHYIPINNLNLLLDEVDIAYNIW